MAKIGAKVNKDNDVNKEFESMYSEFQENIQNTEKDKEVKRMDKTTKPVTKEDIHQGICNTIHETYKVKNAAYGDSFSKVYEELGVTSEVTQISHKYHRLINLVKNPKVDDLGESIEDTLLDMANYCIMTLVEMQNEK